MKAVKHHLHVWPQHTTGWRLEARCPTMDRCGWIVWILHLVLVLGWWTHECGVEWAAGHGDRPGTAGHGRRVEEGDDIRL